MQEARPTSGPIWKVVPGNQVNSLYKEADAQPRHVEEGRGNVSELGCHGDKDIPSLILSTRGEEE